MRPPLDLGCRDTWCQPSTLPLTIRQPSAALVGCLPHGQPSAGHRVRQRCMKRCKEFTACSEEADAPENIGRRDVELWSPYEVAVRRVREKGDGFLVRRTV